MLYRNVLAAYSVSEALLYRPRIWFFLELYVDDQTWGIRTDRFIYLRIKIYTEIASDLYLYYFKIISIILFTSPAPSVITMSPGTTQDFMKSAISSKAEIYLADKPWPIK